MQFVNGAVVPGRRARNPWPDEWCYLRLFASPVGFLGAGSMGLGVRNVARADHAQQEVSGREQGEGQAPAVSWRGGIDKGAWKKGISQSAGPSH